ncbi:MAG TPA: transcription antitermination factor NusB, partial [Burkholderiaceae bacterium]|nr:transcription antitermination factor NusB [Burkholderiaceae bacterium]
MTSKPSASSRRGGVQDTAAADAPARGGSRSARRRAREYALQGLYEWLIGGQDVAAIEGHLLEREGLEEFQKKADLAHFREVLRGAIERADELRAEFGRFIDRDLKDLSPVEHAILLIGSYELKHRLEIPYRVVINEAVELAKGFGGTEGFKYVNGVLDKV